MTEHKHECKCKSGECSELPKKLAANTEVSLLVGGLEYDGTFLQAIDSVVQVRDPFEDSYIATPFIETATIFPSKSKTKCKDKTYKIECDKKSAIKTFQRILTNLIKTPILVQVGSVILSGIVTSVSDENLTLNTASSSSCTSLTKIALNRLSAILVPLINQAIVKVGTGSPISITLINQASNVPPPVVFQ